MEIAIPVYLGIISFSLMMIACFLAGINEKLGKMTKGYTPDVDPNEPLPKPPMGGTGEQG